jgi:cytochrome d ubiquinol oxidase subunit II
MSSDLLANLLYVFLAFSWIMYIAQELFIAGSSALNTSLAKNEGERKQIQVTTGLHFDGMEVWFIAAVAMYEAAFPSVFGVIFSHLYVLIFLLLYALITRGIVIEVIYKMDNAKWVKTMVTAWTVSSIMIVFILGVYISNLFLGYPLGASGMEKGFMSAFNVSSIAAGLMFVALSFTAGAAWLKFTTEGDLGDRALAFVKKVGVIYMIPVLLILVYMGFNNTGSSIFIGELFSKSPLFFILPGLSVAAAIHITYHGYRGKASSVFYFSLLTVVMFLVTGFVGNFPYLVTSTIAVENGLTISETVVSIKALRLVFTALCIVYPIVIGYQAWKYSKFTKKIKLNDE